MVVLGFHKRSGVLNFLIRFFTISKFDHVSLRIHNNIWDARLFNGVRQKDKHPINEYIEEYQVLGLTDLDERCLEYWLTNQEEKKYDFWAVLKFFEQSQESRKSKKKWFCAELVAGGFIHINKPLLPRLKPYKTSPRDLLLSKDLSFLGSFQT